MAAADGEVSLWTTEWDTLTEHATSAATDALCPSLLQRAGTCIQSAGSPATVLTIRALFDQDKQPSATPSTLDLTTSGNEGVRPAYSPEFNACADELQICTGFANGAITAWREQLANALWLGGGTSTANPGSVGTATTPVMVRTSECTLNIALNTFCLR